MAPVRNNIIKFLIILLPLWLTCGAVASAQPDKVPVQYLTGIYNDIKAGKLAVLGNKELHIRSENSGDILIADVYAITDNSFNDIHKALSAPENWCEFVSLHLNIKACTCTGGAQPEITFYAGRKFYKPPEEAYELNYLFQVTESEANRFRVKLTTEDGPYGTGDYVIVVEAVLIGNQTLLHMGLSYATSFISRFATNTYLSTIGSDKVGFSMVKQEAANPVYIKGVNGIIERNVMRYFLALSVYLDTLHVDPAKGFKMRADAWFELTEQYAIQLHELDKQEYMEAKQKEHQNQQELQRKIDLEYKHGLEEENGLGENPGPISKSQ